MVRSIVVFGANTLILVGIVIGVMTIGIFSLMAAGHEAALWFGGHFVLFAWKAWVGLAIACLAVGFILRTALGAFARSDPERPFAEAGTRQRAPQTQGRGGHWIAFAIAFVCLSVWGVGFVQFATYMRLNDLLSGIILYAPEFVDPAFVVGTLALVYALRRSAPVTP